MIKRIIDISDGQAFLSIKDDQLVLSRGREVLQSFPCEDVGLLIVSNSKTSYTHSAFTRLLAHGAAVVLCGPDHLPVGLLLPIENNDLHTARLRAQVAAKLPVRKRLWRQIVRHKIRLQARNLQPADPARRKLLALADEVKSGDASNCEGHAAKVYWAAMMRTKLPDFRRDPDGGWPNPLLNYGYMVFRAACARAVVAGGLHPAIGLHHSSRNNAFCLADDLVEVFRPAVDRAVRDAVLVGGATQIDRDAKRAVLSLLSAEIEVADQRGPLMVGLGRVVASLVRCFEGTERKLDLPTYPAPPAQADPGPGRDATPTMDSLPTDGASAAQSDSCGSAGTGTCGS